MAQRRVQVARDCFQVPKLEVVKIDGVEVAVVDGLWLLRHLFEQWQPFGADGCQEILHLHPPSFVLFGCAVEAGDGWYLSDLEVPFTTVKHHTVPLDVVALL